MSGSKLEPSIKSRPVYGTLAPRPGTAQLLVADAEGAAAIVALAETAPGFFAEATILYIPRASGETFVPHLKALCAADLRICAGFYDAEPHLRRLLGEARMGVQVYLAGTEGLIGQAMRAAMAAGIPHSAIQTEHRGSTVRRVQCVHCKGITEEVTTDPFVCAACGLHLFVRDHYSRRHAAFQGVRVDAEDPGNVPAPVERFG